MKERVVILGGGGHAKVVLDILEDAGEVEIVGFVSPDRDDALDGYRRLGGDDALAETRKAGVQSAFVAIGDNRRRQTCIGSLTRQGFTLINAISRGAMVSRHATLGQGIAVMPGAVINAGSRIEDGAIVNTNATVDHDCIVGRCAHVAPGATLAGCVRLGDGVFLGTGSTVIPKIAIGAWTTVGAGAVVVTDLPDHVLAVGVPAAVRKSNQVETRHD